VNYLCENIVNLDELTQCYDNELSRILNNHDPVRIKILKVKWPTPWYTAELRQLKAKRRSLERKMRKTKLEVDWIAYRKIWNRYCHLVNKARTDYYTTLINDNSHDPKKLYRIVNSLCVAPQEDALPPHNDLSQLANTFNEYQRRATKFILNFPFSTDVDYRTRLISLHLLPVSYWHEYLVFTRFFKITHGLVETSALPVTRVTHMQNDTIIIQQHREICYT
jgi:hypothetical protein